MTNTDDLQKLRAALIAYRCIGASELMHGIYPTPESDFIKENLKLLISLCFPKIERPIAMAEVDKMVEDALGLNEGSIKQDSHIIMEKNFNKK